jgi:hypothetical protein
VLRFSLIALVVVIGLLFALSLLPKQGRAIPDATIQLAKAEIILYPQEDPEAIWYFSSPEVQYDPDIRETTLNNIKDGKRVLVGKTDFTLEAEQVIISSDDNLRGDHLLAHILEDDIYLDMTAKDSLQVLINQREGKFEIPHLEMTQANDATTYERVRTAFDLEDFSAGGEGTIGYNKFEIEDRSKN